MGIGRIKCYPFIMGFYPDLILEVALPDYGEILAPSYAVQDDGWLMLIQVIAPGASLDEVDATHEKTGKWSASPQAKFERLLRETGVPIGVLCNGTEIRLVYAPKGESSGHLTFPVQAMCEVSGRLILGALEMLLSAYRLFTAPAGRRLKDLLEESRKYQAEVSTTLASQVVDALWELLRGFQMADAATNGRLLSELATQNPQHIYGGLITTLMRLVFLLYAEDEGLMPGDDLYQHNYAVSGLFERLRADAGNYPDTIDQPYGAWAWLLSLFRLVYDGGGETPEYLPARHGQLFDPDEYAFLEGRSQGTQFTSGEPIETPRIPDGVVYRMLDRLLMLDGERLSYRSLGVQEIGSVYTAIMGFSIERATGMSIAVRPQNAVINLETLLSEELSNRAKWLQLWASCKVTGKALTNLKAAKTTADLVAALEQVSPYTPTLLPIRSLYLQPSEERRRSGSHYTPRQLTEPIVRAALRPVLEQLGDKPNAEQILLLKVCNMAMGSGAFLVEACRQLADAVKAAWDRDGLPKTLPQEEEPLLHARRLVAQRCLYGVDKNPFAVTLAKLSLWLFTLSGTLQFTFLDHSLKCGDSLVGIKRKAILNFSQQAFYQPTFEEYQRYVEAQETAKILKTREMTWHTDTRTDEDEKAKRLCLQETENLLRRSRLAADLMVSAFFEKTDQKKREAKLEEFLEKLKIYNAEGLDVNPAREILVADSIIQADLEGKTHKQRQKKQQEYSGKLVGYEAGWVNASELWQISDRLRSGQHAVIPFNWEDEFLEVFERENPGFDCIVGNPPFLGGSKTSSNFGSPYLAWLLEKYPESHGNGDLAAFFFCRAFSLVRDDGTMGLVATNTIAQGDTRTTGLKWICQHQGVIYNAVKRFKWHGAAVVVTLLNIYKGKYLGSCFLNRKEVRFISPFLYHTESISDPMRLLVNRNKSFKGCDLYGQGFIFDDSDPKSNAISVMNQLIQNNPKNSDLIFPYIGGEEVNSSPTHAHSRYVINFSGMSEAEARNYSDLMEIVEAKVKPERMKGSGKLDAQKRKTNWWLYERPREELYKSISNLNKDLACCIVSKHLSFVFLPKNMVYAQSLYMFSLQSYAAFCCLQSRIHEVWARFLGSSMKDDLRYTPSDCFETFPFPENWEADRTLEAIGKQYYEFRAQLMVRNNEGLTQTYNRFHDPNEFDPDILRLRQLHEECDRAVLDAYGWSDIQPQCEFLLDYEDEEEDDDETTKRQRKKPYRYRWNEATHDEVLARLLDLNQKRYEQEIPGGKSAEKKGKSKGAKSKKAERSNTPTLLGLEA
ncbi:class I SAM-dependent DNA methyltransferase [Microcoleus sp. FACHB-1515]|uniref:Eco57I restriction-modification methylase domain-containing protein n=1 Tax=Cyanophyceae TaxID=3028117 RepID=UPI00168258D5|nr:DNA methyltransferase [Microcoleus sp. FACHB-1515]MBD2093419.1 class I SAM-dependent DNA methyltransferase [Microcoleus sp. FACHB-1515]